MSSIKHLSKEVDRSLTMSCPWLYKNPRYKLSLCVAAVLEVRSCNTMEIAAALPLPTERIDMRYQWLSRFLQTSTVDNEQVMKPFASQLIDHVYKTGSTIVLCIDQTSVNDDHGILCISIRLENRCLPLFWRTKKGLGNIGFKEQKELLDLVAALIPKNAQVLLLGDRFYGSAELIHDLNLRNWDYRLRLKGNLTVDTGDKSCKTGDLAQNVPPKGAHFTDVLLTDKLVTCNLGIVHEKGHDEPWIIAMKGDPNYYKTMDYGLRWGIESMFSDFKTRGFGLEDTHLEHGDRLSRLMLVLSLALHWAVLTGIVDAKQNPLPQEKKQMNSDMPFTILTALKQLYQQ